MQNVDFSKKTPVHFLQKVTIIQQERKKKKEEKKDRQN